MENVTRRSFMGMGMMGATAAAMANAGIALADNESMGIPAEEALGKIDIVTPADREAKGESTMPLEELNRRRQELVDSKTEDYVCEDGTVIPNVYVKLRTLVNTYGIGLGQELTDTCWGFWLDLFTPEEAQAYLETPKGVFFRPLDFAVESGRSLEECQQLLDAFADRGAMMRSIHGGQKFYRQIAFLQGSCENTMPQVKQDAMRYLMNMGLATTDVDRDRFMYTATPFYRAIPCDASVVTDEAIHPYDDWRMILDSKENFAVAACYCKTCGAAGAGILEADFCTPEMSEATDMCGHPLETCIVMGDEADFFVSTGVARPITKEEAFAIVERSVKLGFMIESYYSKTTEVLCSCHASCCGHLKFYKALPPEVYANSNVRPNNSHYELNYDKDACIKCGACVDRCPMMCIEIDEEGFAMANAHCFRCGQCGMTCPVGARTLTAKPEEEWGFLPYSILDDDNNKAAFRFEHGLIW